MDDASFDELLPPNLRDGAPRHFTPVVVARRASQLLLADPGSWILDVGAAVGKFCLVGGLASPKATFVGVERRRPLVRIATDLAHHLEVPNVAFLYADAIEVDWSTFDGFYLYNPFSEHLRNGTPSIDQTIELDPAYFFFYVRFVLDRLAEARLGTRVVTYHGFGGDPPRGYVVANRETLYGGALELWVKTGPSGRTRPRRSSWV